MEANKVNTATCFYLHKLHHRHWVEKVKATESVQPVGRAGNVSDGQGGRVAGKDGMSTTHPAERKDTFTFRIHGNS